jgi:metal-responsive CopG/Arc/MetJ family transcriptional regulator
MSMCRRFKGKPVTRLIVTMPADLVAAIDQILATRSSHPARGCRSEFLRLAVAEKIGVELMLSGEREPRSRATPHDV